MDTELKGSKTEEKVMKVAMISCHTFIGKRFKEDDEPINFDWNIGTTGGQVLLFQKVKNIEDETLWKKIHGNLDSLEHIVFFTQDNVKKILDCAIKFGLPPERILFLFCSCEREKNTAMIRSSKFFLSNVALCPCGGTKTMRRLYLNIIERGKFSHN